MGERSLLAHRCGFCANNRQSRQLWHNTYPGEERAAEEVTWGKLWGKGTGYAPLVERCSRSRERKKRAQVERGRLQEPEGEGPEGELDYRSQRDMEWRSSRRGGLWDLESTLVGDRSQQSK